MPVERQERWPNSALVRAWQCHSCYQISPWIAAAATNQSPIPINQCINPACSTNRCHDCFDLNDYREIIQFQDRTSVPENIVAYLNYRNSFDLPPCEIPNPPAARDPPASRVLPPAPSPPFQPTRWAPSAPLGPPPSLHDDSTFVPPQLSYNTSLRTRPLFGTGMQPMTSLQGRPYEPVQMPGLRSQPVSAERTAGRNLRLRRNRLDQLAGVTLRGMVPLESPSSEVADGLPEGQVPQNTPSDLYDTWRRLHAGETREEVVDNPSEESEQIEESEENEEGEESEESEEL